MHNTGMATFREYCFVMMQVTLRNVAGLLPNNFNVKSGWLVDFVLCHSNSISVIHV